MKNLLFGLLVLMSFSAIAQLKSKVQEVEGVEVYLLATPVRAFDTLDISGKAFQWKSAITGGGLNESIEQKVVYLVRNLTKKLEENSVEFDAIIYQGGKTMTAIKFTEPKTAKNDRIAEVQSLEGIPFFVMSEPVLDYEVTKTISGGLKWKSALSNGLVNNSIAQDLLKYAKNMKSKFKKKQISAIRYVEGKKAEAILFKE